MINKFNATNLKEVREAINSKLESLKDEFGINVEVGNISYNSDSFSTKLKGSLLGEGGEVIPEHRLNWDRGLYVKHGMREETLGKTFEFRGDHYRIVGCKARRGKAGVVVEQVRTGEIYNVSPDIAKRCSF